MSYFKENGQYAFGIDLSRYNSSPDGKLGVDFDTIALHRPRVAFIAMRAGVSWGYQDACFANYFAEAERIGACILPYHVIYPGEPAQTQVDNFLRILNGCNLDAVRLVLDLELDFGLSKTVITRTVLHCLQQLERVCGRLPILYSRAGWVNAHLALSDLPQVDWWLAQYRWAVPVPLYTPEYPCPPALPKGVNTWLIHQTASRAPSIGAPANPYMDYNRWNGTEADVRRYFGAEAAQICPLDGEPCDGRWGNAADQ